MNKILYKYDYTYKLKYSVASVFLGIAYNFITMPKGSVYLGTGPTVQFASYSKNQEHETKYSIYPPPDTTNSEVGPVKFENMWINLNFRVGAVIHRKLDVSFNLSFQQSKLTNYNEFRESANYIQMRFGYIFGK